MEEGGGEDGVALLEEELIRLLVRSLVISPPLRNQLWFAGCGQKNV